MNSDPTAYILAAAVLSGAIGFMGCALMAARMIRQEREESYWDGYGACNREHEEKDEIVPFVNPNAK